MVPIAAEMTAIRTAAVKSTATKITSAPVNRTRAPCVHSATAEALASTRHATEMPATTTRGTQRNGRGHQNRSGADYAKYKF